MEVVAVYSSNPAPAPPNPEGLVWVKGVKLVGIPVVICPKTAEVGIRSGVEAPSLRAELAALKYP